MSATASRKRQIETFDVKPRVIPVDRDEIPAELIALPQWVGWRWWRKDGRWTKVPLQPWSLLKAATNDPSTWGPFEQALAGTRVRCADGVGFVFAKGGGLFGVDIDDCRDPDTGELTESARHWINLLDSYTEVSPTGTGVKVFLKGELPEGCPNKSAGVEVYAAGRYFTVTGRLVPGCSTAVNDATAAALAALAGRGGPPGYLDDQRREQAERNWPAKFRPEASEEANPYCPPELIAEPIGPGPKFVLPPEVKRPASPRLLKLWAGLWEGYPSQSEADLAMLGMLAKYCDYAPDVLDRWFRVSGLMRKKWDERHAADGSTYGQMCIRLTVGNAAAPSELVTVLADAVTPQPVEWLWPGFVAFGALTVLDGDPGLGKSTAAADLAARLSSGRPMPDGTTHPPTGAILASCEDSAPHTIVPRLAAADADRSRVRLLLEAKDHFGGLRGVQLPDDLGLIETHLKADAARLLVIDPLMAFLGRDRSGRAIDAHRDQSVRVLMAEFKALAERTGAAVLVIRHLNKSAGGSAVYRGGGSIGITGAARGVLVVGKHPHDPDRRVLAVLKSNLGPRPASRAYELGGDGVPVVRWAEACEITADDLLSSSTAAAGTPNWRSAADWLAEELADGPRAAAEMMAAAAELGWTERQLGRARKRLGVATAKTANGWQWSLGG